MKFNSTNTLTSKCQLLAVLLCGLSFLPETVTTRIKLRGAGASFPYEVYQAWIPAYRASRQSRVSLTMTYDPVGSGGGKTRIVEAKDIEYAGSDSLLKDSERNGETDLVMFPTMAGGAVLAYNLPECDQTLNLTRDHLVGIYNGTYSNWNASSLQDSNPWCTLPDRRILVIARREKSGTTSMFTEALSLFSAEWAAEYGNFSDGVDEETELSIKWNTSVIFMHGKGNNGMSGLVQSLRYSIGYMVVSAAQQAKLPFARIQNMMGEYTLPTSEAVQAAMDSHASDLLTVSLADGTLSGAYPIASYTYFVIYKTKMDNCDSAKELIRYVKWFIWTPSAQEECIAQKMVPLSDKIAKRVEQEILMNVTCKGRSMWEAMLADIAEENKTEETWILAVSVSVPLFSALLLTMLGYILWQRYKLVRMIDSDEWDIPIEDIVFFEDKQHMSSGKSRLQCMMSVKSFVSIADIPDGAEVLNQILQWPGKWKANVIGVRLLEVKELSHVTRALKKTMLWMRDSMVQANLVRFYGLTELETERYVIGEYCAKGSMVDILQNDKYNLNNDFKFSLASDIASGMAFLHANSVVHGALTSSCCMIDARWTVKVGDWEYCRLLSTLHPKKSPLLMLLHHGDEDKGTHAAAIRDFWVAPEIIRADFVLPPAFPTDAYSFAIILQEIYTREDPYAELADSLTPQQVVRAVCNNQLRPHHTEDVPVRVRQIMEIAWSDNPAFRPSFDQVVKMLRQSRTSRKSVLDSMMEAMEEYTHHLEEQVAERSAEVTLAKKNLENFLGDSVPQHLVPRLVNGEVNKLASGDTVQGRVYANLGLVMLDVLCVHEALLTAPSKDVLVFLNDLCAGVDAVVRRYGAYRAGIQGETQTIVAGLESETTLLDRRCANVAHLAFDLVDFICNMAPLSSGAHTTSVSVRAGVHVGRVVTGIVGAAAPKFVLLGEGMEVTKALVWCSEPGRVRVSRNVFSHLEKNLDFVSEEAGWIVCAGMEVESFWIRLRIPKKADSVPSDHSVDSGVEVEKSRPDSRNGEESVDGEHVTNDVIVEENAATTQRRSSADSGKENNVYQRFLQPYQQMQTPNQPRQFLRQQQPISQPALSDITEEDERQNSPLLYQQQPHGVQQQQQRLHEAQRRQELRQQQHQQNGYRYPFPNQDYQNHEQFRHTNVDRHQQHQTHLIPTVTVIDSSPHQSNRRAPMLDTNANQSNHQGQVNGRNLNPPSADTRVTESHGSRHFSPFTFFTGRSNNPHAGDAEQSGFRNIPVSTHTGRTSESETRLAFPDYVQSVSLYSADDDLQHGRIAELHGDSSHERLSSLELNNSTAVTEQHELNELSQSGGLHTVNNNDHESESSMGCDHTHNDLRPVSAVTGHSATSGPQNAQFTLQSPAHTPSPIATTSFTSPPFSPGLITPEALNSQNDHSAENGPPGATNSVQKTTRSEHDVLEAGEGVTFRVNSLHIEEVPHGVQIRNVNRRAGSLRDGSESGDRAGSSAQGAGKGKSKKPNKIHPSRRK